MSCTAFAPEYRGSLGEMSVNTAYSQVLEEAYGRERRAEEARDWLEVAHARLAVAEACRRLGRLDQAEAAWKASYRTARSLPDSGAMAWALWSGGTLARQSGQLDMALRWLQRAYRLAREGEDEHACGYALAGIAETRRIRGEHEESRTLHQRILTEARQRDETRHIVWALEGIAQIDRTLGDLETARSGFAEARDIARRGSDFRGYAWALRGLADVSSLEGECEPALELLRWAERTCREMDLISAFAYCRKMRGNVLYRAERFAEAEQVYGEAFVEFQGIHEPRGSALARLGTLKSQHRLGRDRSATRHDLLALYESLDSHQLHHTRSMVEKALFELTGE